MREINPLQLFGLEIEIYYICTGKESIPISIVKKLNKILNTIRICPHEIKKVEQEAVEQRETLKAELLDKLPKKNICEEDKEFFIHSLLSHQRENLKAKAMKSIKGLPYKEECSVLKNRILEIINKL